ncbi:hypothetical protein OG563_07090 [Nocardia vinacea]|uniref:Uncharacterized protein n=1 Tax=Nocardia vinacea TaxID=96468 RepID=A0ABZ1YXF7_9NOCA|nr:hypothetical protein [Nocardia vinacea]
MFPAGTCEFSGDETELEARARFPKMLDPKNYQRKPHPFVRMRYENPRTGLRSSKSGSRMLADATRLEREIRVIDQIGSGGSRPRTFGGRSAVSNGPRAQPNWSIPHPTSGTRDVRALIHALGAEQCGDHDRRYNAGYRLVQRVPGRLDDLEVKEPPWGMVVVEGTPEDLAR